MPVVIDDVAYEFVPPPEYGGYQPVRIAPKVRFQAESGYVHQRERYVNTRKRITIEWKLLSEAEYNMLIAWIEYKKSSTFWYVLPESLSPRPSGAIIPKGILCRIVDEEIPETPQFYNDGYYRNVKITLESIGPEVEGIDPTI